MANLKQNDEDYGETDSKENKDKGWKMKLKLAEGKKTTNVDIWKNDPKKNV